MSNETLNQEQNQGAKANQTKRRKRRFMLCSAIAGLTLAGAGVIASLVHNPVPSIILMWVGLIAAAFALRIDLINNGSTHQTANRAWLFTAIPSSFLCVILLWLKWPEKLPIDPSPIFVWSLKIEGFPETELLLTNDFLFSRVTKKAGDLPYPYPKGAYSLTVHTPAVILVPVLDGESNKVFLLSVEHRARVSLRNPQFIFGVPKEWKIAIDSNDWVAAESGGMISYKNSEPVSKIVPSNMVYFATFKSGVDLFAYNPIIFSPITNLSPLQYAGGSLQGGMIELCARVPEFGSKPYSEYLAANVFFIPASVHFFKPALVCCKFDSEGNVIWPTEGDLLESQTK